MLERRKIIFSLLLIRFGLGLYMILSSCQKMILTNVSIEKVVETYGVLLAPSSMILLGAFELVFSLFFTLGAYKNLTYLIALLLQVFVSGWWFFTSAQKLASPEFAQVAVLFSFLGLYICRHFDTYYSLGKRRTIFS